MTSLYVRSPNRPSQALLSIVEPNYGKDSKFLTDLQYLYSALGSLTSKTKNADLKQGINRVTYSQTVSEDTTRERQLGYLTKRPQSAMSKNTTPKV